MAEIIFGKPYNDEGEFRTFDVSRHDYVWHRDAQNRKIEVVKGNGWRLQIEGCLPFLLKMGTTFEIEENVYHRLIRGVDDLIIKIVDK